ncbi:MAG: MFS transporter [Alphaproteobacteria bacterium]|nr:MFS transporter [Alphaproteobacteria bacterium]
MQPRVLVPLIISSSLLMQNLDSTALVTALPLIAQSLGEPPLRLHMAITAYMLAFAAFLPLSGWLADRFGARKIFRLSMLLFTVASILCGFAQTYEQRVGLRMAQGLSGAMMVPVGRIILVRSIPKAELVGAIALMGMPSIIGPVIGPLLGGFIASTWSWRWIFWINVPIGLIGVFLVSRYIDELIEDNVPPFDWTGFILLGFGLGAVVLALEAWMHWSGMAPAVLFAAGMGALIAYYFHSRAVTAPILDLTLIRIRTFRATMLPGTLFRIGVGANPFLLPMMLQTGFGYSPVQSGIVTCASAIGAFGMRAIAKRVLRAFGFRNVLVWNGLIAAAFLAICALFRPQTPQIIMIAVVMCGGVFRSLQFTSLNAFAYADVADKQMSQATTFQQMAQRLAMSLGIAFAAVILHLFSPSGDQLTPEAFAIAYAAIGVICALPSLAFLRLYPGDGALLAGRPEKH